MNALQAKIERTTGICWGTFLVQDQALRRAPFYVVISPKGSAQVRFEVGIRGRAFYLHHDS